MLSDEPFVEVLHQLNLYWFCRSHSDQQAWQQKMGWQLQNTEERTKGTIMHEFPAPPTHWVFLSNSRFCAHLILGTLNHPLFAYVSRPPFSTSIICRMRTKHTCVPYSTARTSRSFVAALPELSSVNILKPTTIHILAHHGRKLAVFS